MLILRVFIKQAEVFSCEAASLFKAAIFINCYLKFNGVLVGHSETDNYNQWQYATTNRAD
jgi:hypothetical protein